MESKRSNFNSTAGYIRTFPKAVREKLQHLRKTIQAAAPEAEERISYRMPTFFLKGNLVHFAAYEKHIGFYPAPSGIRAFKKELAVYKSSKGAVQFPLAAPLPLELIRKIVRFRVSENLDNFRNKKAKIEPQRERGDRK